MNSLTGLVNVAHLAGPDGKCSRCKAGIGCFTELRDDGWFERPWNIDERVVEYEMPNGRTGFSNDVVGFAQDCIP